MTLKKTSSILCSYCQYLIPQHTLSRLMGFMANCKISCIKNLFIKSFLGLYPVNLSEAERSNVTDYHSFNDFFTRHLKANARHFNSPEDTLSSPVDGVIETYGSVTAISQMQVKKSELNLAQLLAHYKPLIEDFNQAQFITLYLAPQHYHRVHMPLDGKLVEMIYVPGRLFSVNQSTSEHISSLYARNERVICVFETSHGRMLVILVGAMIVGSIHTAWQGQITPNSKRKICYWNYTHKNIELKKGDELGHFQMGSTVILLFPDHTLTWNDQLNDKKNILLGELLGKINIPA